MISLMCKSYNDDEITILTMLVGEGDLSCTLYNMEECESTKHCSGCVYSNVCHDIENLRNYLFKQMKVRKLISISNNS